MLSRRHWIYRDLAEWRDLNATRMVREWMNGESFLYPGSAYRPPLVSEQDELRDFYIARGVERLVERVNYFAPRVGVKPGPLQVKELPFRWASSLPGGASTSNGSA